MMYEDVTFHAKKEQQFWGDLDLLVRPYGEARIVRTSGMIFIPATCPNCKNDHQVATFPESIKVKEGWLDSTIRRAHATALCQNCSDKNTLDIQGLKERE